MIIAATVVAAGCARKPVATATPHPDAAQLVGLWEQFIPIGSMPVEVTLDASGSAALDGDAARWRLDGDKLIIRRGGGEEAYSYTVSGYMMTLFDIASETSCFYINPALFAAGAGRNAELAGEFAEWSGWGKLIFDGKAELTSVVFSDTGSTELKQQYAAQDGILQAVDTSGNYTYNLYSLNDAGALLLAETADYDNDVKQWTTYWKRAEPDAGLTGQWARVIGSAPGNTGLPESLRLDAGGSGTAGARDGSPGDFRWEYYNGGFLILEFSPTDLLYAWCSAQGGVLYLGNPDVDDCWYIDASRYHPTAAPLQALAGKWKTEDGAFTLDIASGALTLSGGEGAADKYEAAAADGLMRLTAGGKTWYAAYTAEGGELRLFCAGMPVIGQQDMPVVFTPAGGQ